MNANMKRNTAFVLTIFLLIWLSGLVSPAFAQGTQPTPQPGQREPSDNEVNAIAKDMFCPVCENIPLDVCPTTACQEWRELIRLRLSEGWTEQQIKDYFVAQYGDRVLSEPPRRGLNWLVYVLPPAFFLFGVIVLWNVFRSMRRPLAGTGTPGETGGAGAAGAADPDDPYLAQIEEELRKKPE